MSIHITFISHFVVYSWHILLIRITLQRKQRALAGGAHDGGETYLVQ